MKIGVIGTGAVGGYYGALLSRAGYDVHFLLRGDFEHVREHGLTVDSVDGDFVVKPVNAHGNAADMPVCDMAVVSLKTTQNFLLTDILPGILRPGGIVVALQNGLNIEDDIQKTVPSATVIGGLCFLCAAKIGPGHIHHQDHGAIRFGIYEKQPSRAGIAPELQEIAQIFARAGIPVRLTEDLAKARWEKLVWNMGFNGPAVMLNATTHEILEHASACALVQDVMKEVVAGANACGYPIPSEFADKMVKTTRKMVDYSPSMKLDHASGKPMEVETIYWRPIRAAAGHGMDMEKCRVLACQLDFLNTRADQIG